MSLECPHQVAPHLKEMRERGKRSRALEPGSAHRSQTLLFAGAFANPEGFCFKPL